MVMGKGSAATDARQSHSCIRLSRHVIVTRVSFKKANSIHEYCLLLLGFDLEQTCESPQLSRLSRLRVSKSSQVVLVPSRRRMSAQFVQVTT